MVGRLGLRSMKRSSSGVSPQPILSVVGGLNMDLVFETERMPILGESMDGTSLTDLCGGKGANTAIAAYRASHEKPSPNESARNAKKSGKEGELRVFMNGAVGDDDFGAALRDKLEVTGIDVTGVRTLNGERSGTCVVIVEHGTKESRNLAYQGANLKYVPYDVNRVECLAGQTGSRPDLVVTHLGVPREIIEQVLEVASQHEVDTILNPSPAVYLDTGIYPHVTHLIMNESEAAELAAKDVADFQDFDVTRETAAEFVSFGVKYVLITLGPRGVYFATHEGKTGHIDAVKNVKVKDTTGAGDSFVGAYAVDYLKQKQRGEWDIERAISKACKAAARTIERLGAQEALPWADEIDGR